jgi:hypothetical protein
MNDKITKEEFEADYAKESNLTIDELHDMGGYAEPCDCEYLWCNGWKMMYGVGIPYGVSA